MSLVLTPLTLASATLSGGARLVSAGGGLPQRITTEAIVTLGTPGSAVGVFMDQAYGFCALDDVGPRFAVGSFRGNADGLRVFNADGSLRWSDLTIGPTGVLIDSAAREVYAAHSFYNSGWQTVVHVYDVDTGTPIRQWAAIVDAGDQWQIMGGSAPNDLWLGSGENGGSNLLRRYSSTGAVQATINYNAVTPGWFTSIAASSTEVFITSWIEPPRAFLKSNGAARILPTYHAAVFGQSGVGDYYQVRAVAFDGTNGYLLSYGGDQIDEYDTAFAAPVRRVVYGGSLPGQMQGWPISDAQSSWGLSASPNRFIFRRDKYSFTVLTRQTARARWSQLFTGAATLLRLAIPGEGDGSRSSAYDDRRVRYYYSFDGGATRTELTPGTPLSVAITAGQTLTIDADMSLFGSATGIAPYVGGDSGEGISLLYDDPAATVYAPLPTLALRGNLSAPPAFTGKMVIL